jgi:hypothetical protein
LSAFFADDENTPTYSDKQKKLIERYESLPLHNKKLVDGFITLLEEQG